MIYIYNKVRIREINIEIHITKVFYLIYPFITSFYLIY